MQSLPPEISFKDGSYLIDREAMRAVVSRVDTSEMTEDEAREYAQTVEIEFSDGYMSDLNSDPIGWSDDKVNNVDEEIRRSMQHLGIQGDVRWEDRELFQIEMPAAADDSTLKQMALAIHHMLYPSGQSAVSPAPKAPAAPVAPPPAAAPAPAAAPPPPAKAAEPPAPNPFKVDDPTIADDGMILNLGGLILNITQRE